MSNHGSWPESHSRLLPYAEMLRAAHKTGGGAEVYNARVSSAALRQLWTGGGRPNPGDGLDALMERRRLRRITFQ